MSDVPATTTPAPAAVKLDTGGLVTLPLTTLTLVDPT